MRTILGGLVAALAWTAAAPLPAAADPLAAYQWKSRLLVALAPSLDDPMLVRQQTLFAAMSDEAGERDLKLVVMAGTAGSAAAVRTRFGIEDLAFHALLIGKDGGDKLIADEPLGADRLFPLIDAMPMRQQEQRASATSPRKK